MRRAVFFLLVCCLFVACGESKTAEPAPAAAEPAPAAVEPAPAAVEPAPAAAESSSLAAAPGGAEVPDVILIVPLGGTKKSISFPHRMHADPASNPIVGGKCEKCHHEIEDGAEAKKCTTSGCHDNKTEDVPLANDSFHKTCRDGCHKQVREAQPGNLKLARLKACKGCHAF